MPQATEHFHIIYNNLKSLIWKTKSHKKKITIHYRQKEETLILARTGNLLGDNAYWSEKSGPYPMLLSKHKKTKENNSFGHS